jgi:hypothetical protein
LIGKGIVGFEGAAVLRRPSLNKELTHRGDGTSAK